MKRLLCIVSAMDAGGAETFLMKIYRSLDISKYQMDFCVCKNEKGFYDDEIIKRGGYIFKQTPKSKNIIKSFVDLEQIVRESNYNYVLRVSQHSLAVIDLLAAKKGGATILAMRSSNAQSEGKVSNILHIMFRFLPVFVPNVKIAPSKLAAEYTFGKKAVREGEVKYLHNGLDYNTYKFNEEKRKKVRKQFGINECIVIGHIGRFTIQKNHNFLLEVFKKIKKRNPEVILLLVGNGELEEDIKNKSINLGLFENIIFAGVRNDIPDLLSAMDVFIFPSLYEGMPNTVIEAQANGLPCFVSDTISKEANITGLVSYLPLSNPSGWADNAAKVFKKERKDTYKYFIDNKYDIQSVAREFEKICYKD